MRKFYDPRVDGFHPAKYDVDANIALAMESIHDPYGFCTSAGAYWDAHPHWAADRCMDSAVAGICETLGLPQGLSFEEVFSMIG